MRYLLAALALLALAAPSPVDAAPMVVTWTTWMRAAPSEAAPVLDEIGTGISIDVGTCQGGWCRVRYGTADGWVMQRYLAATLPRIAAPAKDAACFEADHFTPEGPTRQTLCPSTRTR